MNDRHDNNDQYDNNAQTNVRMSAPEHTAPPPAGSPGAAQGKAPNAPGAVAERPFSLGETLFAWAAILIGYIFCRVFPVYENTLGGSLFILLIFGATLPLLIRKGKKPGIAGTLALITGSLCAGAIFICSNALIDLVAMAFCLVIYDYFVYISCGNAIESGFSDFILFDFLRASVSFPLKAFGRGFFRALGNKDSRAGKNILRVIAGILLAVIPTALILALLSYDEDFVRLISGIFDFRTDGLFSQVVSLTLGLLIGMYIFGLYIASSGGVSRDEEAAKKIGDAIARKRRLPLITAVAAVLPILAVYVIFFISQWNYYTSAFKGVLPEGTIYSEYAREGFFQLCTVSAINFTLAVLMNLFAARKNRNVLPGIVKAISSLLALFSLILMLTAMSKLILYIKMFGLTPKRVYAGWFMCLLALLFAIVLAGQFIRRLKVIPAALIVSALMFALLSLSGTDMIIANYNVDRYLDGSLSGVDTEAMVELGDSGVPALIRLAKELDRKNGTDVADFDYSPAKYGQSIYTDTYERVCAAIYHYAGAYEDRLFSMNLPRILAKRALDGAGIKTGEQTRSLR